MIRLIATDVDGTLVSGASEKIPETLFELIEAYDRAGIRFAVASGRQYPNLVKNFEPVKDKIYFICENGCLTLYHDAVVDKKEMRTGLEAELVREIMATPGCEVLISGERTSYVITENQGYIDVLRSIQNDVTVLSDLSEFRETYMKLALLAYRKDEVPEEIARYFREKYDPYFHVMKAGHGWLDFISRGTGKGSAVKAVMDRLAVTPDELMVFGDNENDVSMFELTPNAWCMSHAYPHVKAKAAHETENVVETLMQEVSVAPVRGQSVPEKL